MNQLLRVTSGLFCGQTCMLVCDDKCSKAWGMSNRPKEYLSKGTEDTDPDYWDDTCYLPDQDLGEAPIDPRTYEGGQGKPQSDGEKHNKWCWRECERSTIVKTESFEVKDFSKPMFKQPWKHQEASKA